MVTGVDVGKKKRGRGKKEQEFSSHPQSHPGSGVYQFASLEARSLNSRCWQGWFLLRAMREESGPGLSPWLAGGPHVIFFLCVSLDPKFPFL